MIVKFSNINLYLKARNTTIHDEAMKANEINTRVNSIQSTEDISEILKISKYGLAFET
jgi:hypothetical protein